MSSMLEQAILDAKDLKEAAIKNAQQAIIEKYSDEFEGEIEKLLEQAAPPVDPMAAAPAMPAMPTAAGAAPVDPEKAKNDSDNKSDLFDKLNYAFADGEVIGGKAHTTGVVEIDLDSLTKFSFQDNQKSAEQMALQELKALSKKTLNEELDEEMNDDDDYDDESETFPYGDDDSDDDELDLDDDDDTEFDDDLDTDDDTEDDIDMDDEDLEDDDIDDMDDLDLDVDIDDEDGTEVDIDDENLEDDDMEDIDVDIDDDDLDMDMDNELDDDSDEDLYDDDDDDDESEFEIDFETDPDDADYNPDADVDTDMDDDDNPEEEIDDEEEELEEAKGGELAANYADALKKSSSKMSSKHSGLTSIKTEKALEREKKSKEKKGLKEAIKLDYKRTGPRSKWTGMFHEEAEHDVALANLQAQIEELEQEVDTLQESNKKLKAGLKESVKLIEQTTAENKSYVAKINQYEEKLHESRLLNYKLLYTNKALSDASLNERQKNKLAESINGAKTAEEVKLLYETLKSTMRDGTSSGRSPKSLSEAVERRSSSLLLKASRAEAPKQNDYAERMKKLAGLT